MAGIMRKHSFAVMTSFGDGELHATHLPFVFKQDEGQHGTLYGHISAQNPHAKYLNGQAPTMVVFNGPHAYISASWYNNPERRVPTWNYTSVKAKGCPIILPENQWMDEMHLLTQAYEPNFEWQISNATDYVQRLMSGIIYFKIPIDDISGIAKLSGGKNKLETKNVIKKLRLSDEHAIANMMEIELNKDIK